jgi:hypothetical protein
MGISEQDLRKETKMLSIIATMLFCFGLAILLTGAWAIKAEASEILYSETTGTDSTSGSNFMGLRFMSPQETPPNWYVEELGFYATGLSGSATADIIFRNSAGTIVDEYITDQPVADGWNYFEMPSLINMGAYGDGMQIRMVVNEIFTVHWIEPVQTGFEGFRVQHNGGNPNGNPIMTITGFEEGGDIYTATTTEIISQNSPSNGSTTGSDVVTFDFDYFYNDTTHPNITIAGVEIRDFTDGVEYIPLEESIVASGESNFSESTNLTSGNLHGWRPYLRNPSGTEWIRGSWYSFDVETMSGEWSPLEGDFGSTSTSTILARFFNMDSKLAEKWPFAYLYDINSAIQNAPADSDEFPTLTIATATSSSLNISATLLSEEGVDTFVPENIRLLFRGFIAIGLWLAFISMIWFTVKRQF